jgi:hypothetical protein
VLRRSRGYRAELLRHRDAHVLHGVSNQATTVKVGTALPAATMLDMHGDNIELSAL